jgi:branched-chain amino acid transport system substrate-binding protein
LGKQFQQSVEAFQAQNGDTVNGTKVEVVYRDAGGPNPAKSKQMAEELVLREKVDMLVGYAFTPNAMAVGKVATQSKTPVIIMNAATGRITRGSEYYVRVSMNPAADGLTDGPLGLQARHQIGLRAGQRLCARP